MAGTEPACVRTPFWTDTMSRPGTHEIMMTVAEVFATRSTCARRQVGCVITSKTNRILSTGYNGTPSKFTHCTDNPCPGSQYPSGKGIDFCEAVHAEQNALVNVSDILIAHHVYVTTLPCVSCIKLLINTPIKQLYFRNSYAEADRTLELWLRDPTRSVHMLD